MYSSFYIGSDASAKEQFDALSAELNGLQPGVLYRSESQIYAPSSDSKQTIVFFTGLTGNLLLTDLAKGRSGDRVVLVNETTYNVTLPNTLAKLAGGANWVGNQYDTITLIFSELSGFWLELARSSNA